jgi:putative transposase
MTTSKFTEMQIAFVLKQAENGAPTAEVCRKAGIPDTYCRTLSALEAR